MTKSMTELEIHQQTLRACTLCPTMQRPPITGMPVMSRVLLVGQAPGSREPVLRRPFAWTAGRTLFGWLHTACGLDEEQVRVRIYIAAVCRCFPGKTRQGGDRVPNRAEIARCARWLTAEMQLLQPELVIPVGRLAISQFLGEKPLEQTIGQTFRAAYAGQTFDLIALPHPSGASPWPRLEPGKTLLAHALSQLGAHPAITALRAP